RNGSRRYSWSVAERRRGRRPKSCSRSAPAIRREHHQEFLAERDRLGLPWIAIDAEDNPVRPPGARWRTSVGTQRTGRRVEQGPVGYPRALRCRLGEIRANGGRVTQPVLVGVAISPPWLVALTSFGGFV